MKSKTIKDSADNEAAFSAMVAGLSSDAVKAIRAASEGDDTLSRAFAFIMDERGMEAADFAEESPEPEAAELYTDVLVEQY